MKRARKALWPIALVLLACLGARAGQDPGLAVRDYRIGPQDLLVVRVLEVPELSEFEARVTEEGSISLPLLGYVRIQGLSKTELEQLLRSKLVEQNIVKNPQVVVFIKEYHSQRVAILGAVEKQGLYELVGSTTLLEMITKAGGIKESAGREIQIQRVNAGRAPATIVINLKDLLDKLQPDLNIPLQPGDMINVPIDRAVIIYVMGEVKSPGAVELKASQGVTLLQAIAKAGGVTDGARRSGIVITRRNKAGKEDRMKINLSRVLSGRSPNPPLQDGDVIYVPTSIF